MTTDLQRVRSDRLIESVFRAEYEIAKARSDDPMQPYLAVEKRIFLSLRKAFRARAGEAIQEAVDYVKAGPGSISSFDTDEVMRLLGVGIRGWELSSVPVIEGAIATVYTEGKKWMMGRLFSGFPRLESNRPFESTAQGVRKADDEDEVVPIPPPTRVITIAPYFGAVDAGIITELKQMHRAYWIGSFYDRLLSDRINEIVYELMMVKGLGRERAARELKRALEAEFGISKGPLERTGGIRLPEQAWRGTTLQYFKTIAAQVATTARIYGHLQTMRESGVKTIRVVAMLDERTCFGASTPVLMEDGSWKPISKIQVGDRVITREGRARPVVAKSVKRSDSWVDLKTSIGTLRTTRNHLMAEYGGGWLEAQKSCGRQLEVLRDLRRIDNANVPKQRRQTDVLRCWVQSRKTARSLPGEILSTLREADYGSSYQYSDSEILFASVLGSLSGRGARSNSGFGSKVMRALRQFAQRDAFSRNPKAVLRSGVLGSGKVGWVSEALQMLRKEDQRACASGYQGENVLLSTLLFQIHQKRAKNQAMQMWRDFQRVRRNSQELLLDELPGAVFGRQGNNLPKLQEEVSSTGGKSQTECEILLQEVHVYERTKARSVAQEVSSVRRAIPSQAERSARETGSLQREVLSTASYQEVSDLWEELQDSSNGFWRYPLLQAMLQEAGSSDGYRDCNGRCFEESGFGLRDGGQIRAMGSGFSFEDHEYGDRGGRGLLAQQTWGEGEGQTEDGCFEEDGSQGNSAERERYEAAFGRLPIEVEDIVPLDIVQAAYDIQVADDESFVVWPGFVVHNCKLCEFMDGKEFTIEQGEALMGRLLRANGPDAVKSVKPWLKLSHIKELSGVTKAGRVSRKQADALAELGLALPDYHALCRCTIDITDRERKFTLPTGPDNGPFPF